MGCEGKAGSAWRGCHPLSLNKRTGEISMIRAFVLCGIKTGIAMGGAETVIGNGWLADNTGGLLTSQLRPRQGVVPP